MWRSIIATAVGWLLGATLGGACALVFAPPPPQARGWTSYPTLANPDGPVVTSAPDFRYGLFSGVLFGGGFGAVAGAIVGMASAKKCNSVQPPTHPPEQHL
jgi:hypothetical protein